MMARFTWMNPLIEYLQHDILQDIYEEARRISIKAPSYVLTDKELYHNGFTMPWLKCVDEIKGREALQRAHTGQKGAHEGAHTLAGKVLCKGIHCPTIHQDAKELTKKCVECQAYSPAHGNLSAPLRNISSPWPFYQ